MTNRHQISFAVYLLLERAGKVLLIRRANSGWNDGKYTLVAGHVDNGESARQAMIREAAEEIGVVLDIADLTLVHAMHRNDAEPYLDLYFKADNWIGEPTIMEPHKADDLCWARPDDLPLDVIPTVALALSCIAGNTAYSEDAW